MAKIYVKDLEKLAKDFKDIKTFEYDNGLVLEVQQYLPIQKKRELVEDVVLRTIVESDGIQVIHTYLSHIPKTVAIIKYYTNLNLPDDNNKAYDLLKKVGIFEDAVDMIPQSELDEIDMMINKFAEDLRFNQMYSNSIETVVSQALNKLIGKLPSLEEAKKFIEDASKEIEGFSPEKLEFINQFIKFNQGE